MEWRGRRQSNNIEDRRGQSRGGGFGASPFGRPGIRLPMGGRRGGGLSIGTIIFLVVIYFVLKAMGIDMLQVLGEGNVAGGGSATNNKSARVQARLRMTTPRHSFGLFWPRQSPRGMRSSHNPEKLIRSRSWSFSAVA